MKAVKNPIRKGSDQLIAATDCDILVGDPQTGGAAESRRQLHELLRLVEQFYSTGNRSNGNSAEDHAVTRTE
jgi:hypothetical protein